MFHEFGWKLALNKEMLNRVVGNNSKELRELNHKNVNSMTAGTMSVLFTVIASKL